MLAVDLQCKEELKESLVAMVLSLSLPVNLKGTTPLILYSYQDKEKGIYTRVEYEREILERWDAEVLLTQSEDAWRSREKEQARFLLLSMLTRICGLLFPPWGTLTGVRPSKLFRSLLSSSTKEQAKARLQDFYGVAEDRVLLLEEIYERQQAFFPKSSLNPVSIYVGIPFCPTRCGYCSFAGYPLNTHGHLLRGYLLSLHKEIEEMGLFCREHGLTVSSVYVGGGTPTILQGSDLEALLGHLREAFSHSSWQEFTVEAGRPETLNPKTVEILAGFSVSRISINPQTMHNATLEKIGRGHTKEEILRAYALCLGRFPVINMDLILGLGQENEEDMLSSLHQILELDLQSITVHSLARKRASSFGAEVSKGQLSLLGSASLAIRVREILAKHGFLPYYLYRQREILGGLENIGYAKEGLFSLYNIMVMEEVQTILGIGAGAVTKQVTPDFRLSRIANPKCPGTYATSIKEVVRKKKFQLCQHFAV